MYQIWIKRQKPTKILTTLAQVEVLVTQGKARIDVIRQNIATKQTYYRSRSEYYGMRTDQLKDLRWLQKKNERLICMLYNETNTSLKNTITH
jgi:putative transposase